MQRAPFVAFSWTSSTWHSQHLYMDRASQYGYSCQHDFRACHASSCSCVSLDSLRTLAIWIQGTQTHDMRKQVKVNYFRTSRGSFSSSINNIVLGHGTFLGIRVLHMRRGNNVNHQTYVYEPLIHRYQHHICSFNTRQMDRLEEETMIRDHGGQVKQMKQASIC